MPERLLVVEDEAHLAEVIADNLAIEGFAVEVVGDGLRALERARAEPPALIVLDVMLPGLDGFTVCERLRAEGSEVPVLFLTARNENDDRVRGLELGGDDYLGKPFDLRELILRVRAIL
jgi:DNA-binding response OmpR family regulator